MDDHELFELGDVVLQEGATLRDAKLAYKTYGTLNDDKSNAIVYPTWYSGRHWENEWLIGEGMAPFDAVNVCQHHLITVGEAYIERVVLEKFIQKANEIEDSAIKTVLKKLCHLYALYQIETHKGWYLEQGYMDGVKTKAIRKLVNQLCWEIRKDAVPLVNAFDIPDACLAAPIAIKQ
jgi:hypothetical protein